MTRNVRAELPVAVLITAISACQDKFGIYVDNSLQLTVSDNQIPYGGVAFAGVKPKWDNVKIGYDDNGDGDIADANDDIVWDENFGATTKS